MPIRIHITFFVFLMACQGRADQQRVAIALDFGTGYQHDVSMEKPFQNSFQTTTVTSRADFESKIDDLVSGPSALKAGDQVVLPIFAHGGPDPTVIGNLHPIMCSDGEMSLSDITPEVQALLNRGVKVSIMDFSCFSGDSLTLKNSLDNSHNLCVITGDSNGSTAMATFDNKFVIEAKPGRSLEDTFLEARKNEFFLGVKDSPGISTSTGIQTQKVLNDLQKIITLRNFTDYDEGDLAPSSCPGGSQGDFQMIQRLAKEVSDIAGQDYVESSHLEPELATALENYRKEMETAYKKFPGLKAARYNTETIGGKPTTWLEISRYIGIGAHTGEGQFQQQFFDLYTRNPKIDFNLINEDTEAGARKAIQEIKQMPPARSLNKIEIGSYGHSPTIFE